MATGSGEAAAAAAAAAEAEGKGEEPVAVVVEKKEGEVSAAAVEKKGEGAVVSEAVEKAPAPAVDAGKPEEESGGMITLTSNQGKPFVVTEASARQSKTIGNLIDDGCTKNGIPLPNVNSKTLAMVIKYCDEHGNNKSDTDGEKAALKKFDKDFIGELDGDRAFLYDVTVAANYLSIQGLLDLTTQCIADTIKGKTPEEIRTAFNIKYDLTEQDEEEIREEDTWAF